MPEVHDEIAPDTLDAPAIREIQRRAELTANARLQRIRPELDAMRELLWSIHRTEKIDHVFGHLSSIQLIAQIRQQSLITRWIPRRLYCWLARKIFVPFTIPYLQHILIQYHNRLEQLLTDQLYAQEATAAQQPAATRSSGAALEELERKIAKLETRLSQISPDAPS